MGVTASTVNVHSLLHCKLLSHHYSNIWSIERIFVHVCVCIHSDWLFNCYSVLYYLTPIWWQIFFNYCCYCLCRSWWHRCLCSWMRWQWALDHTVQVLWGIMRKPFFCALSTNQHVAMSRGRRRFCSKLERKPRCLALFTLHHQPVRFVFWL